ncbi:MAG: AAA family ATPase [Treponema sp.]|jgi:protein phosphatase|nr:AAA family ATPase [Treponema sp.]
MRIEIPDFAVVALVGVSSSGKSTFVKRHFKATEALSSDFFRGLVSDDENNQQVTQQAFDALYFVAKKRLELGLLTVIDATSVQKFARSSILRLAREFDCPAIAIVLDISMNTIMERNKKRPDRNLDIQIIERQAAQLKSSIQNLQSEGFRDVHVLTEEDIEKTEIIRSTCIDKENETKQFDIIGDIHGCYDELCELLTKLGYDVNKESFTASHSENRKVIFLGDLCDRGPKNIEVLKLVMNMKHEGGARCVLGNHDDKFLRKLKGSDVQLTHGLDITVEQLEKQDAAFIKKVKDFLVGLNCHLILDNGKLVAVHAGLNEKYHGKNNRQVKALCLYGETTGEKDEYGLPARLPWAKNYRGKALVVYGHVPNLEVQLLNNTASIDTGCVFGGKLTAYRYPENEIVQVKAKQEYCAPVKPL